MDEKHMDKVRRITKRLLTQEQLMKEIKASFDYEESATIYDVGGLRPRVAVELPHLNEDLKRSCLCSGVLEELRRKGIQLKYVVGDSEMMYCSFEWGEV